MQIDVAEPSFAEGGTRANWSKQPKILRRSHCSTPSALTKRIGGANDIVGVNQNVDISMMRRVAGASPSA